MQETAIRRETVSDAVAERVRGMIVDGALPAGERINEVHLALRLGVSRTPLREALNRLASEGTLTSTPNHGYSVRPLTLADFEEVYAIRPLLDPEALRLAGVPSREQILRLEKLNKAIDATRDADAAMTLDDEWHLTLIASCPNTLLIELIEMMIRRTRRYEIALMREHENVLHATREHAAIIAALKRADLDAACAALKQNMQSGAEPIRVWLKARESNGG